MAKVQYLKGHKCPALDADDGVCPHAIEDAAGGGRLVLPKQIVDVPDDLVWNYVQSDLWDASGKESQALADEQRDAVLEAVAKERGLPWPPPKNEPDNTEGV